MYGRRRNTAGRAAAAAAAPAPGSRRGRVPRALPATLAFAGLLALLGPDLPDLTSHYRRQLLKYATHCIHTVYATESQASLMPPPPTNSPDYLPSHVAMCYEWLRRDAYPGETFDPLDVQENRDVCLDWSAPHYAMMEIVSSSILNTITPFDMTYKHNCQGQREREEALRGFDWTTFQGIFQEPPVSLESIVTEEEFRSICKAALADYDAGNHDALVKSRSAYHPFAFPETNEMETSPVSYADHSVDDGPDNGPKWVDLPMNLDQLTNRAPISAAVSTLRTRIHHSAVTWANVTDAPPAETESGCVVVLDAESHGVEPHVLDEFIPETTTSITVLVGPLCVAATLPTGQNCLEYARTLEAHFATQYPSMETAGYDSGPGVSVQIAGATAALYSRAVLASNLICPPNTPTCLLPAAGKMPPTGSTLLDVTSDPLYARFFGVVGTQGNIEVYHLPTEWTPAKVDPSDRRLTTAKERRLRQELSAAPQFAEVEEPTHPGGYKISAGDKPIPTTPSSLSGQTFKNSVETFEPKLSSNVRDAIRENKNLGRWGASPLASSPNVRIDRHKTENAVTEEEVYDAVRYGVPMNANTRSIPTEEAAGGDPSIVSAELSLDLRMGFDHTALTDEEFEELHLVREASKLRIQDEKIKSGNYAYEIACPRKDRDEYAVVVEGTYVMTDNGRTVIVSDGTGTVIFNSPVTVVTKEILADQSGNHYTMIPDPVLGVQVPVTASGLVLNSDSSLRVTNPVGTLVTTPGSDAGVLITEGKAARAGEVPGTVTVITGTVKAAGNENIFPTEVGSVVRDTETGSLALTATTNLFHGFLDVDPETGTNTGGYQVLSPAPYQQAIVEHDVGSCVANGHSNPVYISDRDGETVTFDLVQTYKGTGLAWVGVDMNDECQSYARVPFGKVGPSNAKFTAACVGNKAYVDVYISDDTDAVRQSQGADITSTIPERCVPPAGVNKCHFRYEIECSSQRRRLTEEKAAAAAAGGEKGKKTEKRKMLWAADILEKCPELDAKNRKFDDYEFGNGVQVAKKAPQVEVKAKL